MDNLLLFKEFLLSKNKSRVTIRNYLSDLSHFIEWYQNEFNKTYSKDAVTSYTIALYREHCLSHGLTNRSLDRHLSSLRSYFSYLIIQKLIQINPFHENKELYQEIPPYINAIKQFKNYLYENNISNLTIKNYISDLKQFFAWLDKTTNAKEAWIISEKNLMRFCTLELVTEYRQRLLRDTSFSPVSVNRKLSSLRKFFSFAVAHDLLPADSPYLTAYKASFMDQSALQTPYTPPAQTAANEMNSSLLYSPIAPFRLTQKAWKGIQWVVDHTVTFPLSNLFILFEQELYRKRKSTIFAQDAYPSGPSSTKRDTGDLLHTDIKNVPRSFYAPIVLPSASFYRKTINTLLYKRPKWYKRYHDYQVVHYLHFAILIVYMSTLGFGFYTAFFEQPASDKLFAQAPPQTRTLAFAGQLTDTSNTPISTPKDVRFALYTSPFSNTNDQIWQEQDNINPDQNGNFSIQLGSKIGIPQTVFESPSLYLGVQIGDSSELSPRQQVATVAYAANSQSLQGLVPITQNGAGETNVVLALDSSGNLTIGGHASPLFQATGGEFRLSGQSVVLESNHGSNGNITLSPDGTGGIDIQKPIFNTSNTGNIPSAAGAVEIDDMLAILATSSGQSAFTINQNGSGPLISASSSGIAKFTLNNDGTGFFAGFLGIGMQTPKTKLDIEDATVGKALVMLNETGNQSILTASASGVTKFSLDRSGNLLSVAGAKWQPFSDSTTALNIANANSTAFVTFDTSNSRVGIGTTAPAMKLDVADSQSATVSAMVTNTNTGSTANVLALKVGNTTPSTTNYFTTYLNGNGAIVGKVQGNGSGGVSFATSGIDFAEYYQKENPTETFLAGQLVCTGALGMTKCNSSNTNLIGVVSDHPGFIGGIDHENDSNYILVGLTGQIPVMISSTTPVAAGDPLTISSQDGIATKATQAGYIIGRALAPSTSSSGTVLASINVSWYDPSIFLTDTGNLSLSQPQANQPQSFFLSDMTGSIFTQIGEFSEALIANLTVGALNATTTVTNSLTVTSDAITVQGQTLKDYILQTVQQANSLSPPTLVMPIAEINEIHTNLLSPIGDSAIQVAINSDSFVIQTTKTASPSAVASIDAGGNATFSGQLNAKSIITGQSTSQNLTTSQATVSGTLFANQIIASSIQGLDEKIASQTALSVADQLKTQNVSASLSATLSSGIATTEASLLNGSFTATNGEFTQGLISLGPTSLSDVSLAGQLSIGGQSILTSNSIDTLGTDLQIQSLKQGGLSIMSGLIYIDTNGNVQVSGNATFAKNVTVQGNLATNLLSPIPGKDLTISLPINQSSQSASLLIKNASGSSVLALDALGNLTASGSGSLTSLVTKNLTIVRNAQADTSLTDTIASSSAGTATIIQGETERTIITLFVKSTSLIYISPTSDTGGLTPYVSRQTDSTDTQSGSFTIAIPTPLGKDLHLNWWIVN